LLFNGGGETADTEVYRSMLGTSLNPKKTFLAHQEWKESINLESFSDG